MKLWTRLLRVIAPEQRVVPNRAPITRVEEVAFEPAGAPRATQAASAPLRPLRFEDIEALQGQNVAIWVRKPPEPPSIVAGVVKFVRYREFDGGFDVHFEKLDHRSALAMAVADEALLRPRDLVVKCDPTQHFERVTPVPPDAVANSKRAIERRQSAGEVARRLIAGHDYPEVDLKGAQSRINDPIAGKHVVGFARSVGKDFLVGFKKEFNGRLALLIDDAIKRAGFGAQNTAGPHLARELDPTHPDAPRVAGIQVVQKLTDMLAAIETEASDTPATRAFRRIDDMIRFRTRNGVGPNLALADPVSLTVAGAQTLTSALQNLHHVATSLLTAELRRPPTHEEVLGVVHRSRHLLRLMAHADLSTFTALESAMNKQDMLALTEWDSTLFALKPGDKGLAVDFAVDAETKLTEHVGGWFDTVVNGTTGCPALSGFSGRTAIDRMTDEWLHVLGFDVPPPSAPTRVNAPAQANEPWHGR